MQLPTLPYRPDPVTGESLNSYLDRVAATLAVPLTTIVRRIGLAEADHAAAMPRSYGVSLSEHDIREAARILRLDPSSVRSMLLLSYDGLAFNFPHHQQNPNTVFSQREWVLLKSSNLCPACLAASNGAWKLCWRLGVSFA